MPDDSLGDALNEIGRSPKHNFQELKPVQTKADRPTTREEAAKFCGLRTCRILPFRLAVWIPLLLLAADLYGQSAATAPRTQGQKPVAAPTVIADPLLPAVAPAVPPPPPTPEQMPPRAPQVTWDGKTLSIKSENATLADILIAVRTRTKAAIEIPPGAAAERVAVDLGPGPAREVLTSLLSGGNFDYVILASDSNEDAIKSVLLTPRGKVDDTMTGATTVASGAGVRRMPGYAESGRGLAERAQEAQSASFTAEPSAAAETPSNQELAPEHAEPAPAGAQQASATDHTAVPDTTPTDTADLAPAGISARPPLIDASTSNNSTGGAGEGSQMRDDLQRLYQQRRQMQTQANQPVSKP